MNPHGQSAKNLAAGHAGPWDHWWHRSPIAQIAAGKSRSRTGAAFWYDHYWKPRELSAWLYELVRRLPRIRISIPDDDRRILQDMPPYPRLTLQQKTFLFHVISRELDQTLIKRNRIVIGAEHLSRWKQGQACKLGNWGHVEAMDQRVTEATREDRRNGRHHALKFLPLVLSTWRLMHIEGISHFEPEPKAHELSGMVFSFSEFRQIVEKAAKEIPKR